MLAWEDDGEMAVAVAEFDDGSFSMVDIAEERSQRLARSWALSSCFVLRRRFR